MYVCMYFDYMQKKKTESENVWPDSEQPAVRTQEIHLSRRDCSSSVCSQPADAKCRTLRCHTHVLSSRTAGSHELWRFPIMSRKKQLNAHTHTSEHTAERICVRGMSDVFRLAIYGWESLERCICTWRLYVFVYTHMHESVLEVEGHAVLCEPIQTRHFHLLEGVRYTRMYISTYIQT